MGREKDTGRVRGFSKYVTFWLRNWVEGDAKILATFQD